MIDRLLNRGLAGARGGEPGTARPHSVQRFLSCLLCHPICFAFFCARFRKPNVIYFVRLFSQLFMSTNLVRHFAIALLLGLCVPSARASDDPFFHSRDTLAPRDEWGVFHQMPFLYPTDFAYRHTCRANYYLKSGRELLTDPAYVAALQVCLRNRGYYCGPIDGINSWEVSDAIARMQKNHTQRVTGTLTVAARRALHLP